jgi:1-acyl-sn-glycerol-3-phosphate acyltransferase
MSPKKEYDYPRSGLIKYLLGRIWMFVFGWKVEGEVPKGSKFIIIGAPHTSNWDLPYGLALLHILRLKFSWIGKDSLFKGPFGLFMKALGGIPIKRSSPQGVVKQIVTQFKTQDKFALVIAPSGTRKKRDCWKSGFYWIANTAQVPIVCGYADYHKKVAGLGLSFMPSGDIKKDMDKVRSFYQDIRGKHPDRESVIQLKDE